MGTIEKERQLMNRLHRLNGQVAALERVVATQEPEQTLNQFEAVSSALKASLALYIEMTLENEEDPLTRQRLITRIIKRS